jgi:hypothetical protein
MNAAFRQYFLQQQEGSAAHSRLAVNYVSLVATMATTSAADNSWQKILAECLEDSDIMGAVAAYLKQVWELLKTHGIVGWYPIPSMLVPFLMWDCVS